MLRIIVLALLFLRWGQCEVDPVPAPDPPPCSRSGIRTAESLTKKQKACIWGESLGSTTAIAGAAFFAWSNRGTEGWEPGFRGYAQRVGVKYAQSSAKSTAEYLAGLITREDPRRGDALPGWHFRNDHAPSFGRRFGRALLQSVCTPRDGGGRCMPAVSHVAGALASGFSTYSIYPMHDSKSDALRRSLNAYSGYVTNSLFREFQGDLFRMFIRRFRGRQGATAPAPASRGSHDAHR